MLVNIITNLEDRKGLFRDGLVLLDIARDLGHEVRLVDFRREHVDACDLSISLEVVEPRHVAAGRRAWWFPNLEWAREEYMRHIATFEAVCCKSNDTWRVMSKHTPHALYTGFTCWDRFDQDTPRRREIFHPRRGCENKGTQAIHEATQAGPLPLDITIAERMTDAEVMRAQNRCLFHLLPTEYEGWGHAMHEALSVGAVIAATDVPACNECDGVAKLIPPERREQRQLALAAFVSPEAVREVVAWFQGLTDADIADYSDEARSAWQDGDRRFRAKMREMMG